MIELLVFDVDGCLTDGGIIYTSSGEELKKFDVKDGLAIASWIRLGKKAAIITGRESKIVAKRAEELKITHIRQGVKNKGEVLEDILAKEGLTFENVAIIGDDFNDLPMLKKAKISFTPSNGVDYVKSIVDTVLSKEGGKGAVREMIDIIIKNEKLEEEFINLWS